MPTSGSYTVGLGGDYLTWTAAFAALGNLTGPLTYTQISLITEVAIVSLPGGFLYGGHLLTLTSDRRHQGHFVEPERVGPVISDGSRVVFNGPLGNGFDLTGSADQPNIIIEYLELECRLGGGEAAIRFDTQGWTTATHKIIRFVIIKGSRLREGIVFDDGGFVRPAYGTTLHHIIVDGRSLSGSLVGIRIPLASSFIQVHSMMHVNVIGSTIGFDLQRGDVNNRGVCRNCYAFNCTEDFKNIGGMLGYNNASSDATATNGNWWSASGNLPNEDPNTNLISYINLYRRYFHWPDPTGNLVGAGSAPTSGSLVVPTEDLAGQQYPRTRLTTAPVGSQTTYSIGAHQPSVQQTDLMESDETLVVNEVSNLLAVDTLNAGELLTERKGHGVFRDDDLGISEEVNVLSNYVLTAEDTMGVQDASINIEPKPCLPEGIVLRGQMDFWYPSDTMANHLGLPQPIDNDSYNLDTQVRIRHAKGGDLRFFKRNEVIHTLLMNFDLGINRRDLALAFFELSSSQLVRLLDWEGRLWYGVIVNTPIQFQAQNKDTYLMSLEFEGTERIN